ncbi:hypothetical protein LGW54_02570 [Streptococcus mutans]|nr:hypothetical protein [Streptococcus mutans]MCB4952185.1 hypothetical protein [Streptococcus mutans]MCB5057776.1 hypothetical protein [Streptococcus mutans]
MQTLFAALDNLENLLSQNDWLAGGQTFHRSGYRSLHNTCTF